MHFLRTFGQRTSILSSGLFNLRGGSNVALTTLLLTLFVSCAPSTFSQTVWFKYDGNPVLEVGAKGSWDDHSACAGRVIRDSSSYRMWYVGNSGMGYATSPDGIRWTKYPANPVLTPSPNSWDNNEAHFGYVTLRGSTYEMWYAGGDGRTYRHIGYAHSLDGIVWIKEPNPVVGLGLSPIGSLPLALPCVVGPDPVGKWKMWFNTMFDTDVRPSRIGFAEGTSATSWTPRSDAVLNPGDPGTWDGGNVRVPRVIQGRQSYEMWYSGSISSNATFRVGYARSPDGIRWEKSSNNPVLDFGPPGSWDNDGVFVGDILFDGKLYYMWYVGGSDARNILRTGLAVSPRDAEVDVTPSETFLGRGAGTIRVAVKVSNPPGLSFFARIMTADERIKQQENALSGDMRQIDAVELHDDGRHGDGLAADGMFANTWSTSDEGLYSVNIRMGLRRGRTLGFEMKNAATFTTIGPVKVDSVMYMDGAKPGPGDAVRLKLVLHNYGTKAVASWITASLSPTDSRVNDITAMSASCGHIYAGQTVISSGYYRVSISPDCPPNTDVHLAVSISSSGIPLWTDRFSLHVFPPWWKTEAAYGLYALILLCLVITSGYVERKRLHLKHDREMERFHTEKLKDLDQLKSRFFANISHEFRTPLTLIEGPLKQLKENHFQGNVEEQYDMMLRNTQRLTRLVNQLLDLSKIESGQMKIQARKLDMVELVQDVAAAFESMAKRKGIKFRINSPEQPIVGWFDRDGVEKIVTNLLSNAFKFTSDGGKVNIRIACRPELVSGPVNRIGAEPSSARQVTITVSDSGIGIPPDQIDKIYDRFYQVDQSQTREYEGTGIGLALTKELVELHKGDITVESELGKGTTFTVRLPLGNEHFAKEKTAEAGEPGTQALPPNTSVLPPPALISVEPEKDESLPLILIIEDNADMRKYIRTHLEGRYRLSEAVNGEDGFQKAVETIPDLVVSDVMMPKMDGFELGRRLRADERTSHIPIILLTAKATAEHKLEGLELGVDDYITKPFDAKELQVRAKNLIEQRKQLREKFRKEGTFKLRDIAIASADERFLNRAMELVEQHIQNEKYTTDDLAREMLMSRMQLHRKIRGLTDLSPGEFIRRMKLERARELLRRRAGTIAEIAYQVGYEDPARFSDAFRTQFGVLPSEFVKEHAQ